MYGRNSQIPSPQPLQAARWVQRRESDLNLFVDFCFVDSALQDHRNIRRHQVTHSLKGKGRFETQAVMPALGIDFADMKLPDSVPESSWRTLCLTSTGHHGKMDRPTRRSKWTCKHLRGARLSYW